MLLMSKICTNNLLSIQLLKQELKSALDKEQSAHKDTNDELLNVRRMLKEARKNLDEVLLI